MVKLCRIYFSVNYMSVKDASPIGVNGYKNCNRTQFYIVVQYNFCDAIKCSGGDLHFASLDVYTVFVVHSLMFLIGRILPV